MARFLIRRSLYMAAVMVGISMIVFGLSRLTGDPRLPLHDAGNSVVARGMGC